MLELTCLPTHTLALELAVKANKVCELEDGPEGLLLELGAPVPGRCEAAIDAGAGVKEVVSAGAVKAVAEKVRQDALLQWQSAAK